MNGHARGAHRRPGPTGSTTGRWISTASQARVELRVPIEPAQVKCQVWNASSCRYRTMRRSGRATMSSRASGQMYRTKKGPHAGVAQHRARVRAGRRKIAVKVVDIFGNDTTDASSKSRWEEALVAVHPFDLASRHPGSPPRWFPADERCAPPRWTSLCRRWCTNCAVRCRRFGRAGTGARRVRQGTAGRVVPAQHLVSSGPSRAMTEFRPSSLAQGVEAIVYLVDVARVRTSLTVRWAARRARDRHVRRDLAALCGQDGAPAPTVKVLSLILAWSYLPPLRARLGDGHQLGHRPQYHRAGPP